MLRSQVGGTSDIPRQARRYDESFERQRTQPGDDEERFSHDFYEEQEPIRPGRNRGQGADRYEF
jgi:hypothetical protein